jgi:DNA-binding NtrC family response regulator
MEKNMRILFVDDDADDRMLFMEAVKEVDENYECVTANDGRQALELLNNDVYSLPDIIFLDINMPRLSGKKCLSEIKNNERLKHIPVIIYTTSKDVEESKELKELGAYHFISKPRNAEDIYFLVSIALEEHLNFFKQE